jgi:hypothetical protein
MDELQQPDLSITQRLALLHQVLTELEQAASATDQVHGYVLERFHPSYYALLPAWSLYRPIDVRLRALHARLVLLDFDAQHVETRSLDRSDRQGSTWTQEMIAYYGSRTVALHAIALSQARRRASIALTTLPAVTVDTTAMDWATHADQIITFWQQASWHEPDLPMSGQGKGSGV